MRVLNAATPVRARDKVRERKQLADEIGRLKAAGKKVVFTNGCFDLLHPGHVRYLETARSLGDILIVALNSDESVRRIKGEGKPLVGERERAEMLGGTLELESSAGTGTTLFVEMPYVHSDPDR